MASNYKGKKTMKVCLVNPPSPFESEPAMDVPLGLAYLSSYLKHRGITDISLLDYNLLDYNYDEETWLNAVPYADIYGVSVTTPHFYYYDKITKRIREKNSNAVIVAGGPHPTIRPLECLEGMRTDYVIRGEGEEAFYDLIVNGVEPRLDRRYIVKDLDSLPFPDRMLTDTTLYKRRLLGQQAFHVVSARDCPYSCSFCSKKAVGHNIRFRSEENFISELMFYEQKYGVKHFIIYDDTFTVDKTRAMNIAKRMGERGYFWRCFTRTDKLDESVLRCFKENKITSITLGVETFSPKMLKVYNKNTTAEDNMRALKLCKDIGIPVRCSLIYGGPYETRETLQETINGVEEAQPDEWNVSTLDPIPGSDIGDNPEKYDISIIYDPFYLRHHRVGETGMGEVLMDISTMTRDEYVMNRRWFIEELERVCPRRQIQDTIQRLVV